VREARVNRDKDYSAYVGARWSALVRSAVLLGCSPQEAEDLVQTTLTRCYTSWDRVARASNREADVYRVLVNGMHKSRRRRWWREQPTTALPDSASTDHADGVVLRQSLRAALGGLSEDHRKVLVLRFFADLTEREVAEVLGVPAGTVKSRVSRALALLSTDVRLTDHPDARSS
ncbi:MAG: SigE family RNA polymerase sigma factor, partial [Nocardioides sp.]